MISGESWTQAMTMCTEGGGPQKLIHSFNKYVVSASCVQCTVLSHRFTAVNKTDKNSFANRFYILMDKRDDKQRHRQ